MIRVHSEDAVFEHAARTALEVAPHRDVKPLREAVEVARHWALAQARDQQRKYTSLVQRLARRTAEWAVDQPVLWRWVFVLVIPTITWTLVPWALRQPAPTIGKFALLFLGVSLALVAVSSAGPAGQVLGRIWALVGVVLPVWLAGSVLVRHDGGSEGWSLLLLVLCIGAAFAVKRAVQTVLPTAEITGLIASADQALERWRSAVLNDGVLPVLRAELRSRQYVHGTKLKYRNAEGLRRGGSPISHQPVPAGRKLAALVRDLDGGSFALAGPRGSGKTSLLEAFCQGTYREPGQRPALVVMVSAPVEYVPKEFVLHLYARTCHAVLSQVEEKTDPPAVRLVQAARRSLQSIDFVQTRTGETAGKIGFGGTEISYTRGVGLTGRPATFPELVSDFREFLRLVASTLAPTRVVIAVDEVDHIGAGEPAGRFLDEIKAIFGVPGCYYVVSVPAAAEHDFDEVVRVEHLDYELAKKLVCRSVEGLPDTFIALAHAFSGGLARQLIRTVRAIVREEQGTGLAAVTEKLISAELPDHGEPIGAARAGFLAVVRDHFTDDLTEVLPAQVDALAKARRCAESNPAVSLALLAEFSAAGSARPAPEQPPR